MYNSVFNSQGCPDSNLIENEMYNLKAKLDSIAMYDGNGNPFWSARDLQSLLGYVEWRKFEGIIKVSIQNCIESGFNPNYQFVYISPEDAEKFDFGGNNTAHMKDILGVPKNRSINDFLGNVPSLFKAAASEYNIGNVNEINIDIATDIHNRSNKVERDAMIELVGISPEDFPAEEDYNKIKRKANKLNDRIEKGADYYIDPSLEDSNNSPITENEFNYFVSRGYVFIKTSDLIFYRMYGCLPQDA